VVVGVHVQPDPLVPQPVRDPHAEHVGVEDRLSGEVAGEEVRVPELPGAKARQLIGRARHVRPNLVRWPVGNELDPVSFRINEMDAVVTHFERHSGTLEVSGRLFQGEATDKLERVMVEARLCVLD
jgi:hypothetical protein